MKTYLHLALLAASSALLLGQTAPAPSPRGALPAKSAKPPAAATGADKKSSADSADAVVELNVFEVKPEDDEYRAAHSTSGTRYNMPIHDLPMQVGVLTEQFLRDVGAADIIQAIEYMGGVQFNANFPNAYTGAPEYGSGSGQFVQIRGMQTEALTRNNFARIFNIDAVSIGRIDTISGPGGGLYGAKAMGGAVNTLTSIPQARPSYFFRQYVGDHDYFRTEAKLSGPLLRNGRVRHSLAMSQTHNRTPNMYEWYDRWVVDATLAFQLTRKTDLRLQHEYQHQERSALRFSGGGNGNAAVFQDTATVTPGGEPYGVTIFGRESLGPMLAVPNVKRFRFDGPDTHHNLNFRSSTVLLTHSFTPDLVLRLSYNREDRRENRRSYAINIRRDTDSTVAPAYRNDPRFARSCGPASSGAPL